MSDIETNLHEILRDHCRLQRLLMLEKERRGVPKDALVFVGMANVASHWWCTQQAVLKSRANELEFFRACLSDRVGYARHLGIVSKLPSSDDALLDFGKEITLAEVEKLLREKEQKIEERPKRVASTRATLACIDGVDSSGNRTRIFNPDLRPEERKFLEEQAAAKGIRVIDLEEDPKRRGVLPSITGRTVPVHPLELLLAPIHRRRSAGRDHGPVRLRVQDHPASVLPARKKTNRVCAGRPLRVFLPPAQ